MAEAQATSGRRAGKKPRVRARIGRHRAAARIRHRSGLALLIIFTIAALGVLAAGLLAASLTIFATNPGGSSQPSPSASNHGAKSATSSLVGRPIDGTIVAVSVTESLIAIQPSVGTTVQASVTASSNITRGGVKASLASLIPGEAVIVTFAAGPGGTLVVTQLQDIESVPTNTPSPTPTPFYYYYPTPTPSAPVTPTPSAAPSPGGPPSPPGNGGPPTPN
ncbi:MAG: hypothetical protein ACYCZN_03995 [Candidatus Dormibacteria bacterium]